MTNRKKAFLLNWEELISWKVPVKKILSLPDNWDIVQIKDIARKVETKTTVDLDKEYSLVGVKWYGQGTFIREKLMGSEFSASKITQLVPNAFIYNRLFAWKSSFAIVPVEHSHCYVSNEFPQFIIDETRVLSRFIYLYFMLEPIIKAVKNSSVGSAAVSRNRFKEEEFLEFEIPIPPLELQKEIVSKWEILQKEIEELNKKISDADRRYDDSISQILRLELPTPKKKRYSITNWEEFDRWDTFFYKNDFLEMQEQLSKYDSLTLDNILHFTSRAWKKNEIKDDEFNYIEISGVNKDKGIFKSRKVQMDKAPSRATTLIREGDIILSTTRPYLGAFSIVPKEYDNYICSSGFVLADKLLVENILKEYLLIFLKSSFGLKQMERYMSGGSYPAIVQSELNKVKVPIPSLEVQEKIIQEHREIKKHLINEENKLKEKKENLNQEIENIFSVNK